MLLFLTFHTWVKPSIINRVFGRDRVEFLEKLVVGDVANTPVGKTQLSLILNEKAGIIDDTIFSTHEGYQ